MLPCLHHEGKQGEVEVCLHSLTSAPYGGECAKFIT